MKEAVEWDYTLTCGKGRAGGDVDKRGRHIEERLHVVMKLFINQNSSSSLTGRLNHRTLLEYISWGGLCKFILSAATFSKVAQI